MHIGIDFLFRLPQFLIQVTSTRALCSDSGSDLQRKLAGSIELYLDAKRHYDADTSNIQDEQAEGHIFSKEGYASLQLKAGVQSFLVDIPVPATLSLVGRMYPTQSFSKGFGGSLPWSTASNSWLWAVRQAGRILDEYVKTDD